MSNHSIIEHRANYHFVMFEEDFLMIAMQCKYKKPDTEKSKSKASVYCKALILSVLESWTNDKRDKEQDLAVYMTYPQWIDSLYGIFRRNTIIDSIDELLGEGLISRETHVLYDKKTWKYHLNCQEVNTRLKLLPEKPADEKYPKVKWTEARREAFTSKRQDEEVTSKPDAVTSKRQSNLLVNGNAVTSKPNIESTENLNLDSDIDSMLPESCLNNAPISLTEKRIQQLEEKNAQLQAQIELLLSERTPARKELSTISPQETFLPQDGRQENESPIAHSTTRKRRSKKQAEQMSLLPPVEPEFEPEGSADWNAGKAMQWADFFRGYRYPVSNHANAKYRRALENAQIIVSRGITEQQFVYVFRYMKGIDEKCRSDYWHDKDIDIWTVNDHYESQVKEIKRKKGSCKPPSSSQPSGAPKAATEGSQYIVDELQSRYEDNFNAWLKTPEGMAAMAEYDVNELQYAAAGGD